VALPGIITLTTDFGTGEYAASLKGVILRINPEVKIIDICHTIQPQNIIQASYIIDSTYSYFPEESIHLVVVDPGVGSKRKAIIVKALSSYFIAPDNGVLSSVLDRLYNVSSGTSFKRGEGVIKRRKLSDDVQAVSITNTQYWNQQVSPVFHGRDIFAPVAAHLSLGLSINNFGQEIRYVNMLENIAPYKNPAGEIIGRVVHIDYFGNIITNIDAADIPDGQPLISIGDKRISGIDRYYAEKEGLIAIIGSSGHLEISLRNGNASIELGINIGDEVTVLSE
jgi:S-adenosylmethionine hydrolase